MPNMTSMGEACHENRLKTPKGFVNELCGPMRTKEQTLDPNPYTF